MKYLQLRQTLSSKGEFVAFDDNDEDLSKLQDFVNKAPGSDWYRSLFWYGQDAKDYFTANNNSINNYKGKVISNRLTFDFDSKNDISAAQADVQTLLRRLQTDGIKLSESIVVYFSGSKGFHIELLIDEHVTPEQMKALCSKMAEGLPTFDTVIYNTTRIYRIPNTKHQVTGLYKIPLTLVEIKTLTEDDIKTLAKSKRDVTVPLTAVAYKNLVTKYNPTPVTSRNSVVVSETMDSSELRGLRNVDFSKCPKTTPRCIYALEHGVMVPKEINPAWGGRSNLFFRLATYYRNQGKDKEVAHNLLKGIARLNAMIYKECEPISKEEIYNQHIASAYSPKSKEHHSVGGYGTASNDPQLKMYCDALHTETKCCLHTDKTTTALKIDDVANLFTSYAENLDNNIVKTGLHFIDDNMKITVGTTTLLVGAPGGGKTTLALNMLENASKLGQHAMFFSLDMHKNLVYQKLAQKVSRYNQDEILYAYKTRNEKVINEIKQAVNQAYKLTFFEFSKSLSITDMRDIVLQTQEKQGVDIRLVIVDYAGRIPGPYSDTHANANFNALKSPEVAEDTNAAWIYISQIARASGDGSTPLRSKRVAKESGAWEESASNVITMWRPFMGLPEDDKYVRMFLAKNRMGPEVERVLKWNGAKGTVTEFTETDHIEWQEYEQRERDILKAKASKTPFPGK